MDDDHDHDHDHGITRRHALECMIWAGTGVLWTLAGGVPKSLSLLDGAEAAQAVQGGFTFLQISDSHVGFDKPANPDAIGTLKEADRPGGSARQVGVHAAYGRYHASLQACRVRRC